MKITHVIRGDDHLSNTPKQVQCYRALGYPTPAFAHIPLILGPDKNRLSKRHGATSVQAFREAGIVAEALFNYLARLGWSHGDQEVFSREEVAEHFDLAHVGLAAAVFDRTKLEWLSQHWIKTLPAAVLAERLPPFLERAGLPVPADRAWLARVVATLQERAKTLVEMAEAAAFYFRAARRVRQDGDGQVLDARGARIATRSSSSASTAHDDMDARRARGALPRAGRRARAQARRSRPAHPHRAHRARGEPAHLRDHRHPGQGGDAARGSAPPRPRRTASDETAPPRPARPVRVQRRAPLPGGAGRAAVRARPARRRRRSARRSRAAASPPSTRARSSARATPRRSRRRR